MGLERPLECWTKSRCVTAHQLKNLYSNNSLNMHKPIIFYVKSHIDWRVERFKILRLETICNESKQIISVKGRLGLER